MAAVFSVSLVPAAAPQAPAWALTDAAYPPGYPFRHGGWAFAEGCTREGFETWLCIRNQTWPNRYTPADVKCKLEVWYITNAGLLDKKYYDLPLGARFTINVNAEIGPGHDVSFLLFLYLNKLGTGGIVVERPMYFAYAGRGGHELWQGGHVAYGFPCRRDENSLNKDPKISAPGDEICGKRFYFAEGTTRQDSERHFDEWICVLNPEPEPAKLTFNYMIEGEGLKTVTETLPPQHRGTWYVADHIGKNKDVSLELLSDVGVVAERPMYFKYRSVNPARPGRAWYGGHVIMGLCPTWTNYDEEYSCAAFPFAPTTYIPGMGWGDTWLCLQNPHDFPINVEITAVTAGGIMGLVKTLPPKRRTTFYYPEILQELGASSPGAGGFVVRLHQESHPNGVQPYAFFMERPVYMEFDSLPAAGQTPSGGTTGRGRYEARGGMAEGCTRPGFKCWLAMNKYVTKFNVKNPEILGERWDDPTKQDEVWFGWECIFPADSSPDPHGPCVQRTISIAQTKRAGISRWWETYLWLANNDFPDTDLTIRSNRFTERVMVFLYRGKWAGMHTAMP
ncbi:MAG: hypothetical protein H5T74_03000 [Actinobacteria bacterium]|nr:hypothetical protein [Actinomycetota bacterium]